MTLHYHDDIVLVNAVVRNETSDHLSIHTLPPLLSSTLSMIGFTSSRCQEGFVCLTQLFTLWSNPIGALPRGYMHNVHGVDLFETSSLRFDYEEVYNDCSNKIACREDIPITVVNGVCDI